MGASLKELCSLGAFVKINTLTYLPNVTALQTVIFCYSPWSEWTPERGMDVIRVSIYHTDFSVSDAM